MSNDISYVIKVVDDYSANIRKFQAEMKSLNQTTMISSKNFDEAKKSSKFFTQNLIDLGKAAGIYASVSGTMSFAKSIFNTRIQMDGLNASLAAIMPKFDHTKSGAQLAAEEIDYLHEVTNRLGISFQEALPSYMQFLASSKQDLQTTRKTFEAFSGISRLYGLSAQRFGLVITALNQMQSKGVVSMEELRQQLGESLPGALDLFAESAGMSTAKFMKLVAEGRIGSGLLKIVAENIERKFGKDIVEASKTLGAETEKLGNAWYGLKDVLGRAVAPELTNTVKWLTYATTSAMNLFAAINDQSAFSKLGDELKAVVTILRVAKGLLQGLHEELTLIGNIAKNIWTGAKQAVEGLAIAGYAATGAVQSTTYNEQTQLEGQRKLSIAQDAFQELWGQITLSQPTTQQSPQVNITVNKAAPDTSVEVSQPQKSSKLRTGNMTNYQEAY